MSHLKTIKRRASTINMLPSVGKPDLGAAARLMVPMILEALHALDNEKNAINGRPERAVENPSVTGTPPPPNGVK